MSPNDDLIPVPRWALEAALAWMEIGEQDRCAGPVEEAEAQREQQAIRDAIDRFDDRPPDSERGHDWNGDRERERMMRHLGIGPAAPPSDPGAH